MLDGSVPLVVAEDLQVEYGTSDNKRKRVLNGVNLRIEAGETIGVAGRSGCGKSTWLKIMMRLIHPSGGNLSLGGVPIDSVSREAIGDLIGYVGQNPFVFSGTIAENIAYGCEYATLDQIREAAKMACIDDEIMKMPGEFQARVSERGQNLSGGQRQRIALARVFLKNPPILILDEGTSALDNISERRVQRAIHAARTDRTVILVAHRLSTLLDTDRIFVFDEGRVVETGTYNELVRANGVFTELVLSAAADFAPPPPLPVPPPVLEPVDRSLKRSRPPCSRWSRCPSRSRSADRLRQHPCRIRRGGAEDRLGSSVSLGTARSSLRCVSWPSATSTATSQSVSRPSTASDPTLWFASAIGATTARSTRPTWPASSVAARRDDLRQPRSARLAGSDPGGDGRPALLAAGEVRDLAGDPGGRDQRDLGQVAPPAVLCDRRGCRRPGQPDRRATARSTSS